MASRATHALPRCRRDPHQRGVHRRTATPARVASFERQPLCPNEALACGGETARPSRMATHAVTTRLTWRRGPVSRNPARENVMNVYSGRESHLTAVRMPALGRTTTARGMTRSLGGLAAPGSFHPAPHRCAGVRRELGWQDGLGSRRTRQLRRIGRNVARRAPVASVRRERDERLPIVGIALVFATTEVPSRITNSIECCDLAGIGVRCCCRARRVARARQPAIAGSLLPTSLVISGEGSGGEAAVSCLPGFRASSWQM